MTLDSAIDEAREANAELLSYLYELDDAELAEALSLLPVEQAQFVYYDWELWARPDQFLPGNVNPRTADGAWTYWIALAGRGWGKTRTGAETVRKWVGQGHNYVNLIGATVDDARDIMIEGESGILAVCPPSERPRFIANKRQLRWPNGAVSLIFTADEPERLRGKQHEKLWADELAAWRYPEAWAQAKMGLRLGSNPQAFVSTTPRPFAIVKEIVADVDTLVTRGTTYDNRANLAKTFFSSVIKLYEGTRLGRQELNGEILDDNPNALFHRKDIDKYRVTKAPQLSRVVVAIDPAVTSEEDSDETGIVVAGQGQDDEHGYILDDLSGIFTPPEWARKAVGAYYLHEADHIVAEANNGGEMVSYTIKVEDEDVPVTLVHASRGKQIRAEPIALLYEKGMVHHVGTFGAMEDQMCDWEPTDKNAKSPDRLDANVWALTELLLKNGANGLLSYMKKEVREVNAQRDKEQRNENDSYKATSQALFDNIETADDIDEDA